MTAFPRLIFTAAIALTFFISLGTSTRAAITVVGHYTFNDNATPAGFTHVGTPTYSGGQLILDGTNALRNAATPLTATDNFGIEAIITPSAHDAFNFFVSNNTGTNNGWGLLSIGGYDLAIAEGAAQFGNPGQAATLGVEARVALVRNGGISTFYYNGTALGTTTNASRAVSTILTIGANQNSATPGYEGLFKGSINEVRLFTFEPGAFTPSDLLTTATIPEPGTSSMLVVGLASMWRLRRRRR